MIDVICLHLPVFTFVPNQLSIFAALISIDKMESKVGENALFMFATEGILIVDNKGHIIKANPSVLKLFGYESDELINQRVEILIPKRVEAKHIAHREGFALNPHPRAMGSGMDLFGKRKDESEFPLEISLSPFKEKDQDYFIAFIVDISLRKQAEERLKDYSIDLEKQVRNRTLILEEAIEELEKTKGNLRVALAKEKELNELKSRFVSMASHEFRTPLTAMMSSLSLVTKYGEQNDTENQFRHVNRIKKSINSLTDILNDFLSVSKLEEGKLEFLPEQKNIKQCITEIAGDMRLMLSENQTLLFEHTGNEVAFVDSKLIKNILFNLVSNAIKFSPKGGQIVITSVVLGSTLKIEVKDSGVGIPKADQKHLFERFFRGHNVTHIQGTGLGLNIVAKYAELMNATLDFESEENKGTTFSIIIPQ